MLQAQAIKDDKAKLSVFVAMTATSEQHPVPPWMTQKGLTWLILKRNRTHVRQDLEEGWRWMADFLVALVKRYGNNLGIANLVLGEYYPSDRGRPADFNFNASRGTQRKFGLMSSRMLRRTQAATV